MSEAPAFRSPVSVPLAVVRALVFVLGPVLLAPSSAGAFLLPVDQVRFVSAGGAATLFDPESGDPLGTVTDGDTVFAPDLGVFDRSTGVAVRGAGGSVDGIALQRSEIGPSAVDVLLRVDSNASAGETGDASGISTASFQLSFDVSAPGTWRLFIDIDVASPAAGAFALSTGGELLLEGAEGSFGEYFVPLEAGRRYELAASVEASSASSFGSGYGSLGELALRLEPVVVPEPGSAPLFAAGLAGLAVGRRQRLSKPSFTHCSRSSGSVASELA